MGSTNSLDDRGLLPVLVGDGRSLLAVGAVGLVVAGGFAFFLAATGAFLPHDLAWLGMSAAELRALADGRVAAFMFHDRVAFGGTLVAVGILYLWLVAVPLATGERWAWRLLLVSTALGFASFLGWLGFGYLDTWHGVATLVLLPLFAGGLVLTRPGRSQDPHCRPPATPAIATREEAGRLLLVLTGLGMTVAGLTILTIGSFVVFVPQDIEFLGLDRAALDAIDPSLVPLIAHDRSGFGGGLATAGVVVMGCAWWGEPSRSLWQAMLVAGVVGFGAAAGIHPLVAYVDATHLAPAVLGALVFVAGIVLARPSGPPSGARAAATPPRAPVRLDDAAVAHPDDPIARAADLRVMGHHQERLEGHTTTASSARPITPPMNPMSPGSTCVTDGAILADVPRAVRKAGSPSGPRLLRYPDRPWPASHPMDAGDPRRTVAPWFGRRAPDGQRGRPRCIRQ